MIFVLATDDLYWSQRMFRDLPDVEFVSLAGESLRGNTTTQQIAFDFAVLSHCQRSIFGIGTFGFWSSYLANGEVILATGNAPKKHDIVEHVEQASIQGWTIMQDPCFENNGELTSECVLNRLEFGVTL